jgi:hypothetical protein
MDEGIVHVIADAVDCAQIESPAAKDCPLRLRRESPGRWRSPSVKP